MAEIVKFPDAGHRKRTAARRPRRSKNGTPEERAAARGDEPAERIRKQRCSKNGTPEERAAKRPSAQIVQIEQERGRVRTGESIPSVGQPSTQQRRVSAEAMEASDQPSPTTAA